MHDYQRQQVFDIDPDELFDYLSDVSHLPDYFPRMTSAELVDADEVRTEAVIDVPGEGSRHVEGTAWFRRDPGSRRLEWGSEGDNDYHGQLMVSDADGGGAEVTVEIHTESEHEGIAEAIDDTLAGISEFMPG